MYGRILFLLSGRDSLATYKVQNVLFYCDGTWRYDNQPENRLYRWRYEDNILYWSPTADQDKAYWIPWHNNAELVKEFRRTVVDMIFHEIVIEGTDDKTWKV